MDIDRTHGYYKIGYNDGDTKNLTTKRSKNTSMDHHQTSSNKQISHKPTVL